MGSVRPHTGPTNTRLAISLGLDGADNAGARMRVGNVSRSWTLNRALVFDDSFEHEVWNEGGDEQRAVLIVHFAHPAIMPEGTNGAAVARLGGAACEPPLEEDAKPELEAPQAEAPKAAVAVEPLGRVAWPLPEGAS